MTHKLSFVMLTTLIGLGTGCMADSTVPDTSTDTERDMQSSGMDLGGTLAKDIGTQARDMSVAQEEMGATVDLGQTSGPDFSRPKPTCAATGTLCGSRCVYTQTDSNNCGGCGRTCVIPHATASCVMSKCEIATCDGGFLNLNGDVADGCEAEDACNLLDVACSDTSDRCVLGATCQVRPGLTGTVGCTANNTKFCQPGAEICNAVDDNDDGVCDEALMNCRIPMHRGSGPGEHFYSTEINAYKMNATDPGPKPKLESRNYFMIYDQKHGNPDLSAVHLCVDSAGKHFLSGPSCEGNGTSTKALGFWSTKEICLAVPLYHLTAPSGGSLRHFYTLNAGERDNAVAMFGYTAKGIVGYVWRERF